MGTDGPIFEDDRVAFFGLPHLFVAVWNDAPQLTQMQALADHGRAWESENGPCALINVAAAGSPKFSDDVRRIAADLTRDATLFQVARAHVILMTGFAGVAVRAFINTFLLLGSPPRPTRMLSSIDAAAQWLPQHLEGTDWTAESLARETWALVESRST